MTEPSQDPVVRKLRDEISSTDRAILEAVNRRLELVAKLKAHKVSQGYALVDPSREDWILNHLTQANRGPLSAEGLKELYEALLELTKREVAIEAEARSST
jgi:chorismate mutase